MSLSISFASRDLPAKNPTQEELVSRSQSGDLEAFNQLVALYYDLTYRMAFRILESREIAEDATQEIFLKAWRNIRRFKGASRFSTWLYTIAVNQCLDLSRRMQRNRDRFQPLPEEDRTPLSLYTSASAGENERQWETRMAVQAALLRLPEEMRLIVTLHFYSDYTLREVAAALDLSSSTVYSRLQSALKRLERLLKDPVD